MLKTYRLGNGVVAVAGDHQHRMPLNVDHQFLRHSSVDDAEEYGLV